MKKQCVYFTASLVGKKHFLTNYMTIVNNLVQKGCDVISDHIINMTPEKVDTSTKQERLSYHTKMERRILDSDFVVVEATFPSMSVGYEVSLALNRRKPVLILYSQGEAPALFAYHESELLTSEKYSPDTISDILDDFINYVKGLQETRFTFFITRTQAHYLDTVSAKQKIPKSVYLRNLIDRDMKRNS